MYDNPKGEAVMGAMGLFGGIFAPDHLADWPPVDPNDPQYKVDVADNPAYPGTKH